MPLFRLSGQADDRARDFFIGQNPTMILSETISAILRFSFEISNDLEAKTLNGKPLESCDYKDLLEPPAVNVLEVGAVQVIQQVQPPPLPAQEQLIQFKEIYPNSPGIIKFISTSVNMEDVKKFLKLVQHVHDNLLQGLLEFICVLAPSYTGKTQLALSVDKLCASRLYPSAEESPVEPLLQACIRFACQGLVTANYTAGQNINKQIFTDAMKDCLEYDFTPLKEFKNSTSDLKKIISDSSIESCFALKKSNTLGLIVSWFRARVDGSDSKALQDRANLSLDVIPLNLFEARDELKKIRDLDELGRGKNLPFLFILDEYSLVGDDSKDCFLVVLLNLIKALKIVAVTMGTNSNITSMTAPISCGGDSGMELEPWALVVTDIFRPLKISNINEAEETLTIIKQLHEFEDEEMELLRAWLDSCPTLRPGFYTLFWSYLKNSRKRMNSPLDLILYGLQALNSQIRQRKANFTDKIEWVVGQVESLLVGSRVLDVSESLSILLNSHYAFSVSHSDNIDIPFYSLFRQPVKEIDLQFVSIPWKRDRSGVEMSPGYDFDAEASPILGYPPEIKCPVSVDEGAQIFSSRCGYPAYENDEMGYLSMFAGNYPLDPEISLLFMGPLFRLKTDSSMTSSQREIYQDLIARIGSSESLTTRAAVTLDHRFLFDENSPYRNSEADPARSGDFLEAIGLAAFTVASQKCGFSGAVISKFIPFFIEELALCRRHQNLNISTKGLDSLGFYRDFVIPFIPRIDATCSAELQALPGFNSGSMGMVQTSDAAQSAKNYHLDENSKQAAPGSVNHIADSFKGQNFREETERVAIGFADRLMTEDPRTGDFHRDVKFSVEFRNLTDGKEQIISIGKRLIMSPEEPSFVRTPKAHFHFLVVPKLTDIIIPESWLWFKESLPGLEVRIAKLGKRKYRSGSIRTFIDLINPLSEADKAQTNNPDVGKTEGDGPEIDEVANRHVPKIMIIVPVEDLFPEDGIITYLPCEN